MRCPDMSYKADDVMVKREDAKTLSRSEGGMLL
jgi:hypothetical protein